MERRAMALSHEFEQQELAIGAMCGSDVQRVLTGPEPWSGQPRRVVELSERGPMLNTQFTFSRPGWTCP